VSVEPPKVRLRIERTQVPRALAAILAEHTVEDVIVEDPPLEEVIAALFSRVQAEDASGQAAQVVKQ
jgi:ABC-2 type transport system ATP-binding protein